MSATAFELKLIGEASEFLRVPVSTLRYWRQVGTGPQSARIGGRVMYKQIDLENWLNAQFDQDAS
ncbi:helix-turn-helix domain-containing protein [Glutamicibacter arilaitensis]|uniref:helix-turn-helix domain-containing protein n=1 Tax=Glutamicibacter arilaitensis TaxID=256701 RepID=UPI003FD533E3